MVEPSPLQVGQDVTVCICPRKVFCTFLTCPLPLQVLQVCILPLSFAPLPLHVLQVTYFLTLIFFEVPFAISSKFSFSFTRKLVPLCPVDLLPPPPLRPLSPPPPKKPPKISSPKISPNWLKISSILPACPPPNPPVPGAKA